MATPEYDIQIRRDTSSNWTVVDTVLKSGELGYETNTGRFKVGDGATAWSSLVYQLVTLADVGVINGVAPLGADGKVPAAYIDQVAIASSTAFTPSGNLTGNDVQEAIQELDSEKAAKANETLTGATLTGTQYLAFDTTPPNPSYAEGQLLWNPVDKTLDVQVGIDGITMQVGQEFHVPVFNSSGSTILNGRVVIIGGAVDERPTVELANANNISTSQSVLGVTTHDISNLEDGRVTTIGLVRNIDTSAWPPGTTLYLDITDGSFTSTQPLSPNYVVHVGHVVKQHSSSGSIYVNIETVTQTANSVRLSSGAGVAEMNNVQDFFRHSWSSGVTDGCNITNNGDGTVSIEAGEMLIRETVADDAVLTPLVVPAQINIPLTANDVSYLYVNYNGGSLVWQVGSSLADFDGITKVIGYVVGRNANILNIVDLRKINVDSQRKARRQKAESDGVVFNGWWRSLLGKSTVSASGLNLLVAAGKYFYFDNPITHVAFNTVTAGTALPNVFRYFYNRTGIWTQISDQKTVNNTQYDSGGTLTALAANRYRKDFVYVVLCGSVPYLAVVMGTSEQTTLVAAQAILEPILPPQIDGICVLVGDVVAQQGSSTLTARSVATSSYVMV